MMTNNDIAIKLKSLGVNPENAEHMIADVQQIVSAKILNYCFSQLPPEIFSHIQKLSAEEVLPYVEKNNIKLENISDEILEKIHDEVWTNYFEHISN